MVVVAVVVVVNVVVGEAQAMVEYSTATSRRGDVLVSPPSKGRSSKYSDRGHHLLNWAPELDSQMQRSVLKKNIYECYRLRKTALKTRPPPSSI